jgi:hypothetical protein
MTGNIPSNETTEFATNSAIFAVMAVAMVNRYVQPGLQSRLGLILNFDQRRHAVRLSEVHISIIYN